MKNHEAKEQFEAWLLNMDDAIRSFVATLPLELQAKMDGSPESLERLEAWLLLRYGSLDAARLTSEAIVIGGATRYLGEVLRAVTGSHWAIELEDEQFAFRGLPVLRGGKLGRRGDCPQSMVTASLARRTGRYMADIVRRFTG